MKWTSNHVMLVFLKKLKTATTNPDANCVLDIFVVFEKRKTGLLQITYDNNNSARSFSSQKRYYGRNKHENTIVAHWVSLEV